MCRNLQIRDFNFYNFYKPNVTHTIKTNLTTKFMKPLSQNLWNLLGYKAWQKNIKQKRWKILIDLKFLWDTWARIISFFYKNNRDSRFKSYEWLFFMRGMLFAPCRPSSFSPTNKDDGFVWENHFTY